MRINTAIKEYLVEIEIKKYSERTIYVAKVKLRKFMEFCNENDIEDTEDITPSTIKLYTQHMTRQGMKGTTINGTLKTIKSFIQYCYEEDFGGFNTKRGGFKWVRQEKPIITTFSRRDVKSMLDSCRGMDFFSVRDNAIITMLFETGIRCLESINIKPEDIKDDYIIIQGKNNKQRVVPITPILKKALMRYERTKEAYFENKNTDNYLFLSKSGKKLTNSIIQKVVRERGAAIEDIRVSPHTCRHFFAQQQVKMGVDLYTISRLLGHENISITQIYLNSLKDEDIIKIAKGNSVLMSM